MNHPVYNGSNRMMRRCWRWLPCYAAALALVCLARGQSPVEARNTPPKGTVIKTAAGGRLVINSRSVLYDFAKRLATFEKNVSVTDEQIMLTANRMDVFLTAENSVQRVEATGDVVIRELGTAKKATAGKAIYDTVEETVVLTENPYLEDRDQGFFTKGADRILYLRAKQQFKAEGDGMQIEFGIPEDRTRSTNDLFRLGNEAKGAGSSPAGGTEAKKEAPAP